MILYLLRHGEALPAVGPEYRDADRILSPDGVADIGRVGKFLADHNPLIDLILTSPVARARQTGEILLNALASRPSVASTENLSPGFSPAALVREVWGAGNEHIVAVGHQPDMSACISYLVAGNPVQVEMKPGAMAAVAMDDAGEQPSGSLLWVLNPSVLKDVSPNLRKATP